MKLKKCSVPDCPCMRVHAKGLCKKHYVSQLRKKPKAKKDSK